MNWVMLWKKKKEEPFENKNKMVRDDCGADGIYNLSY